MGSSTRWLPAIAVAVLTVAATAANAEDDVVEPATAVAVVAPPLDTTTFAELRDFVRPTKEETAWRDLGWHPTLWGAVVAAHRAKKPILLWAMNGHPLGCT
jgi:hypothetical protein